MLLASAFSCLANGCASIDWTYFGVEITVSDEASMEPIAGAEVHVEYPTFYRDSSQGLPECAQDLVTDESGRLSLQIADGWYQSDFWPWGHKTCLIVDEPGRGAQEFDVPWRILRLGGRLPEMSPGAKHERPVRVDLRPIRDR